MLVDVAVYSSCRVLGSAILPTESGPVSRSAACFAVWLCSILTYLQLVATSHSGTGYTDAPAIDATVAHWHRHRMMSRERLYAKTLLTSKQLVPRRSSLITASALLTQSTC